MSPNSKIVDVKITFKNTEPTDAISAYGIEKIKNCIQKFTHHDTVVDLVLKVEKNRHVAEASFRTDNANFHASEGSDDMYKSIDALADTLEEQMRRHKEKVRRH